MDYVTATNREFVELFKGLEAVKNVKGTRFAFIVAKNIKELSNHLEEFEVKATPSPEFQVVAAKAHKWAEAEDEKGIRQHEEDHADLIEQRKTQLAEIEELMGQEASVALHLIKESNLPEDLTTDQILPLLRIVITS